MVEYTDECTDQSQFVIFSNLNYHLIRVWIDEINYHLVKVNSLSRKLFSPLDIQHSLVTSTKMLDTNSTPSSNPITIPSTLTTSYQKSSEFCTKSLAESYLHTYMKYHETNVDCGCVVIPKRVSSMFRRTCDLNNLSQTL